MIAADTNLLIYSHREDSEFHDSAKELVDRGVKLVQSFVSGGMQ